MEKRFVIGVIAFSFLLFRFGFGKPVDIVLANVPADEFSFVVPDTFVTITDPIEPSRQNCENQAQTPKFQYVLDYTIQLPCLSRQQSPVPRKPLNKPVKVLSLNASPPAVRKECICREPTVLASDLVVSCPMHPSQTLSQSPNTIAYPGLSVVNTNVQNIKSRRLKRELPKKKFHLKKPIFGKFLKNEKLKNLQAHKINKRDVSDLEKRQIKTFQLKTHYKYPEIVQYFPEVLSANYKAGECFTCCSTKKKGEIICQPNTRTDQLVGKTTQVTYPGGYTSDYTSSTPMVEGYHGTVEVFEQDDSETDRAFREYIKAVIHSHEDFIKAEGAQKELVVSEEKQRQQAQEFIQKLIADQLSRNHEDDHYSREFRSVPIAIVPTNLPPNDSSFLVKLTQPLNQPGTVVPPVKPSA